MKLPKEWYTIEDLCKRWDYSKEDVEHLIETEKLNAYTKEEVRTCPDFNLLVGKKSCFIIRFSNSGMTTYTNKMMGKGFETSENILIVIPQEVDRFELEHGMSVAINVDADRQEAYKELRDNLKLKGFKKPRIAKELKLAFSEIIPYRIGLLLTDPDAPGVAPDTYRTRGVRLLQEQAKIDAQEKSRITSK